MRYSINKYNGHNELERCGGIVKCVSADVEGNATLAKEIEERHGHVDTVIANAGMSST